MTEIKKITTTCSYDCGGRCLLEVHVRGNKVVKIRSMDGDGLHLKACPRGLMQKHVLHHQDRLKRPLIRTGKRGGGRFREAPWHEALDMIAEKFRQVIREHGTRSVYFIPGSGSLSVLNNVRSVSERFFGMLGRCTTVWGGESLEAAYQSSLATFGTPYTAGTRDNLIHSKYIILWGWDPEVTRFGSDTHFYLKQAKRSGVKIVSVDPRLNQTAKSMADRWVPIIPGTDAAMLMAMAQVMMEEDICDRDFIEKYTCGFQHYSQHLMGRDDGIKKDPSWASAICGVPAQDIRALAREYALIKPAALMTGWAAGRSAYGEQFQRAASVLAAMTGNIGVKGGFVSGGADIMDLGRMEEKIPVPDTRHNLIHNTELYDALLEGKEGGYPADCKIIYLVGSNLLNQYLNLNKGIRAFRSQDFIVVHELFMTPTARFADIVLPVSHYLEKDDVGLPWVGGHYVIPMNRAVPQAGEARSDLEIFTDLSARMGIDGYNELDDRQWLERLLKDRPGFPELEDIKGGEIHRLGDHHARAAFQKQINDPDNEPFPTPSGKIEIFSSRFHDMDDPMIPPIPKYIPTWEGRDDSMTESYPIQLITPHSRLRINSQLDNIREINSTGEDRIWINPLDASKRDIEDGDMVLVYNGRGKVRLRSRVTERIMEGVASMDQGKWYSPDGRGTDRGGNPNMLTLDRMSPAGAFTSNTCLVQIERCAGPA